MSQKKVRTKPRSTFVQNISIPSKKTHFPIESSLIETLRTREKEKIIFSFRFLDLNTPAFNLGGVCGKWYPECFNMLLNVSALNRNELIIKHEKTYRCHSHNWDELDYKFNFDDDFLEQIDCRQIRISKSKGGIHGFLIGNTFYVVWLDPHHNLYPDDRYGGVKIFDPPDTCCSYRDKELEKLNALNKELMQLLDDRTS